MCGLIPLEVVGGQVKLFSQPPSRDFTKRLIRVEQLRDTALGQACVLNQPRSVSAVPLIEEGDETTPPLIFHVKQILNNNV